MEDERPAIDATYHPQSPFNPYNDKEDNINVGDQYELLTKFSMEPNLGHYGYEDRMQHINKNLLFTSLKREFDEPATIQRLSKALTILSGHTEYEEVLVPTGQYYKEDENEVNVLAKEILVRQKIASRRFKRLEGYIASKVFSITATAAGTNAKLLETLKSTFLHKEQSIEDRTETKSSFWGKVKKPSRYS